MNEILPLLISFQIKHFLCDFVFQTQYMLRKSSLKGWTAPLFSHVLVHGLGTLAIVVLIRPELYWLALADATVHFVIDRAKVLASAKSTTASKKFWVALGLDQSLHHVTHYLIIGAIIWL